ncbi:50S ribosomal protein L25 [Chloroflexota bacterium]
MAELTLQASKRDTFGKKTRLLRHRDITPAHLFGHNLKSLSLQCNTADIKHIIAQTGTTRLLSLNIEDDKQPRSVFIREIQRDVISGQLLHVDFYQILKNEKIKADIPVVFFGEAPALKEKGRTLTHGITSLSIECLPGKLPPQIDIDLSPLEEKEQTIYVKDITLSPDITLFTDPDQMVVKVSEVHVEKIEEEVVEEEVEEGAEEEAAAEAEGEAPQEEEKTEQ